MAPRILSTFIADVTAANDAPATSPDSSGVERVRDYHPASSSPPVMSSYHVADPAPSIAEMAAASRAASASLEDVASVLAYCGVQVLAGRRVVLGETNVATLARAYSMIADHALALAALANDVAAIVGIPAAELEGLVLR